MLSDPSEVAVDMKGQEQVGPQMPHFVFFCVFYAFQKKTICGDIDISEMLWV